MALAVGAATVYRDWRARRQASPDSPVPPPAGRTGELWERIVLEHEKLRAEYERLAERSELREVECRKLVESQHQIIRRQRHVIAAQIAEHDALIMQLRDRPGDEFDHMKYWAGNDIDGDETKKQGGD